MRTWFTWGLRRNLTFRLFFWLVDGTGNASNCKLLYRFRWRHRVSQRGDCDCRRLKHEGSYKCGKGRATSNPNGTSLPRASSYSSTSVNTRGTKNIKTMRKAYLLADVIATQGGD